MSETQSEVAIAKLQKDVQFVRETLEDRKKTEDVLFEKMDKLITKFEDSKEKMEAKFAAKWVEWCMKGAIGIVLSAVLLGILADVVAK